MLHGVGRRLRILHRNIGVIFAVAYPRREGPLSDEEQVDLTLHLNSFYLHIRGCLDNLAWCLTYELGLLGAAKEDDRSAVQKVNLSGREFLRELESIAPEVAASLRKHSQWFQELKDLRDPVAHRIPIYAVPSVLNADEEHQYRAIYQRAIAAKATGNLTLASDLFDRLESIGSYMPYFAHSFSAKAGVRKVYPQVVDDLCILLDIVNSVTAHFEQRLA